MKLHGSKLFLSKDDVQRAVIDWLKKGKYSVKDGTIQIHPEQNMEAKHTRGGVIVSFLKDDLTKINTIEKELTRVGIQIL